MEYLNNLGPKDLGETISFSKISLLFFYCFSSFILFLFFFLFLLNK